VLELRPGLHSIDSDFNLLTNYLFKFKGNNQWIECEFKQQVCLVGIGLQFQGGFTSNKIILQFFDKHQNLISEQFIYAVDKNHLQVFNNLSPVLANSLKLIFTQFSDPFGRIIIYKLELIRKDT